MMKKPTVAGSVLSAHAIYVFHLYLHIPTSAVSALRRVMRPSRPPTQDTSAPNFTSRFRPT